MENKKDCKESFDLDRRIEQRIIFNILKGGTGENENKGIRK
jgi:hypothetical protein